MDTLTHGWISAIGVRITSPRASLFIVAVQPARSNGPSAVSASRWGTVAGCRSSIPHSILTAFQRF